MSSNLWQTFRRSRSIIHAVALYWYAAGVNILYMCFDKPACYCVGVKFSPPPTNFKGLGSDAGPFLYVLI